MLCFRKLLVAKNLCISGGVSKFYVENFLSESAVDFRRGTL